MREIKFRAWYLGYKDKAAPQPKMLYDDKPGDCLVWKNQKQNLEVMQYTGMKDREGKEIYEGDIVNTRHTNGMQLSSVVEWSSIGYRNCFYLKQVLIGLSKGTIEDLDIEVIGNIYENPELVK